MSRIRSFVLNAVFIGVIIGAVLFHHLYMTHEAIASLTINRLEIYFENRRAETTVERNTPNLKANALIRFSGSGLLQGNWQVDGRPIGYVSQNIFSGQTVILQTPDSPSLPTFDPGTHRVQFVPTQPILGIPVPTAIYFVSAGEFKDLSAKLILIEPVNKSVLEFRSLTFKWKPHNEAVVYLIELFDKGKGPNSKPVYSALTKEAFFVLGDLVLTKFFKPKAKYYWRVKGLDQKNRVIGESDLWSLRLNN